MIDAIQRVFGKHRARAVHAKGVTLEGEFAPSEGAASVSSAPHLHGSRVCIVVRFSNFTGLPNGSDLAPNENPRGMAVKFYLPGGSVTDIVAHSFNGFPTATTLELRELFQALAAAMGGSAPAPVDKFFAAHPKAKAFFEHTKLLPLSYGTLRYYGVNAFRFTSASSLITHGRYQLRPEAGEHFLDEEGQRGAQAEYLREEIRQRVARGPIRFRLFLQIAEPSDRLADPSTAWPDTRPLVELGRLSLRSLVADEEEAERTLRFSPAALSFGITAADPMILERDEAYRVSSERRRNP